MENNNRKYYTFLALNKCIADSGNGYVDITAELNLTRIEFKEVNDKLLCTARAAINNRSKVLNNYLGTSYPETDAPVWVDVNLWESRAERFKKFVGDRDKVRVVVVGSVARRTYTKNDGNEGESVSITVNDWLALPTRNGGAVAEHQPAENDDLPY